MLRAALLLLAALPAAAQQAPQTPQAWFVYAGGYSARSAMDALSVVRTGNVARFTQAVVSTTTQWKRDGQPIDYFVATVEYDCAARSARSVRIEYFDRAGNSLKANERPDAEFVSGANASEFTHFAPVACREPAAAPPTGHHATLAGFLAANAFWNLPPKP